MRARVIAMLRRLRRAQEGQAAVELMLLMPFLALFILVLAELFFVNEASIDCIAKGHRAATRWSQGQDMGGGFELLHQVAESGQNVRQLEVLPGIQAMLKHLNDPLGRTTLDIRREMVVSGGSMCGLGQSYFGVIGDAGAIGSGARVSGSGQAMGFGGPSEAEAYALGAGLD